MKSILITGCSTGFGRVTALCLAERGWRVIATVRRPADREELLAEAAALAGAKSMPGELSVVLCDITQAQDVADLARQFAGPGARLDGLLNNAGTGFPGPLELLPLDDVRAQLEVNLIGQLAVIKALLPALKAARGMILNVSSVGGQVAFPLFGAYHMSKFAVEAMSAALRFELAHFGVRVVVLAPGGSPTATWGTGRRRLRANPALRDLGDYAPLAAQMERRAAQVAANGFAPEVFARTVYSVLNARRPRARYMVPPSAGLIVLGRRLLPDWLWELGVRYVLRW
jgi:NAD(P)-dependent dehydrogenase (short-subunit alcohol dehydrogenase family)